MIEFNMIDALFDEERRFERIKGFECVELPTRKTEQSAGYDIASAEDIICEPHEITIINTGLKAYVPEGEYLGLYVRSSVGIKKGLMMANGVGIIDSDYVDNPENEGHIRVALYNAMSTPICIKKGERIAQGIFSMYFIANNDNASGKRMGGIGSTN